MDVWIYERVDGQTDEWMDGGKYEWMKLTIKWINGWIDGVMMDGLIPMLIPVLHPCNDGWMVRELPFTNKPKMKTAIYFEALKIISDMKI